MVKNNIELDIKVKCVEEHMTQADIAKKVETPASYVNKLIRRDEGVVNNTYVNFNAQYPTLTVKKTQVFHDRFIILDGKTAYHIGASIKDAGKKCFGISLIDDPGVVGDLLNRLKTV